MASQPLIGSGGASDEKIFEAFCCGYVSVDLSEIALCMRSEAEQLCVAMHCASFPFLPPSLVSFARLAVGCGDGAAVERGKCACSVAPEAHMSSSLPHPTPYQCPHSKTTGVL